MDINNIKDLIKLVETTGITGLSVDDGKLKVEIKKQPEGPVYYAGAVASAAPLQFSGHSAPVAVSTKAEKSHPEKKDDHAGLTPIKSPMPGTFYAAPSPDAPPFVKVGDKISAGKPICIIEAMKTFNEIEAEHGGTVEKILVKNGETIEYGQVLLLVRE